MDLHTFHEVMRRDENFSARFDADLAAICKLSPNQELLLISTGEPDGVAVATPEQYENFDVDNTPGYITPDGTFWRHNKQVGTIAQITLVSQNQSAA